jgi:hypothetical protein
VFYGTAFDLPTNPTMRLSRGSLLCLYSLLPSLSSAQCPLYSTYAAQRHEPFSEGRWNLSYARPVIDCRNFWSTEVEEAVERLAGVIKDPDLFRVSIEPSPRLLNDANSYRSLKTHGQVHWIPRSRGKDGRTRRAIWTRLKVRT